MVVELQPPATQSQTSITWEILPEDYPIPDDPVDNRLQPLLAAALNNSLRANDRLPPHSITCTNYPLCATLNGRIVLKAPDWAYIPQITVPMEAVDRSYTPHRQGDPPAIVLEFLSHTEGSEYSNKPTYPPGKWFFYEQILKVPTYGIFDPATGDLEIYHLDTTGRYQPQKPDPQGRYWIPALDLALGIWQGTWEEQPGHWLRWWDQAGNLLLWSSEQAEQERQRAEQERQRADRLLAQLRAAGLEPEI
jgi:hypothetical protein